MKFGLLIAPGAHMVEKVVKADRLGFDSAFFIDSPAVFADPYAIMTAVALQTKRIMLSTGVTNPLTRSVPVAAGSLATINALAPGRVALGIGTGHSANLAMGQRNAKLSELERFVTNFKELLRGDVAEVDLLGENTYVQFLNPDGGWINIKDPIPVYVAAARPKILTLAGKIADRVILGGIANIEIIKACRKYIDEGARSVGKRVEDIEIAITPSVYIAEKEPTFEELREFIGPKSFSPANSFSVISEETDNVPQGLKDDFKAITAAFEREKPGKATTEEDRKRHLKTFKTYVTKLLDWQYPLVTKNVLEATSIAGTPEQCIEKIELLKANGIDHIILSPIPQFLDQTIDMFAKHILPRYAGK